MMIYCIGDTHFGDPRVQRLDRRPFFNMVEHDAALILNWNEQTTLADFMSEKTGVCAELLVRLNGREHLIIDNNDPATTTSSP
ncbi:hypothetical protein [Rhizobium leguminosarum]